LFVAVTLACLTLTAQPSRAAVLYSQLDSGLGSNAAVASQNFEAALDAFDSQGADDFAIPSGTSWHITELFVDGFLSSGGIVPVTSVNVFVYADSAGAPGALFTSDDAASAADAGGDLTIAVDLTLPSGVWWLSVQANLDFSTGGQWFWLRREPATDGQGHWRNPGDGFSSGATDWTAFPDLSFITTESSDLLFEVRGTAVSAPSTLALIGIGAAGWVGLARRRRARSA
jgi:hypothetical protein